MRVFTLLAIGIIAHTAVPKWTEMIMMDGALIIDLVETVMCSGKGRYHITIANDSSMSIWADAQMAKWVKEPDRDNHWHCSACGSVWGL